MPDGVVEISVKVEGLFRRGYAGFLLPGEFIVVIITAVGGGARIGRQGLDLAGIEIFKAVILAFDLQRSAGTPNRPVRRWDGTGIRGFDIHHTAGVVAENDFNMILY